MDQPDALISSSFLILACGYGALGAIAGFLAGLLGVGGGIVLVPGLYVFLVFQGWGGESLMHACVGTSLAIIALTGMSSARAHWRRESVDMDLWRRIGVGVLVGVVLGSMLANKLSGEALEVIFAVAISILAMIMVLNPARYNALSIRPVPALHILAGLVIGGVSTLIGIGGATLSVPYMSMARIPIHRAVGTASALGLAISIPAALGYMLIGWGVPGRPPFSIGFIHLPAWAMIVPLSMLMAPVGAAVAHRLPVTVLRRIFAVFMIVVALKMGAGIL